MKKEKGSLKPNVHVLDGTEFSVLFDAVTFETVFIGQRLAQHLKTASTHGLHITEGEEKILLDTGMITESDDYLNRVKPFYAELVPNQFRVLDVIPTFECNLACKYCYQVEKSDQFRLSSDRYLSIAEGEAIVDAFLKERPQNIISTGRPYEMVFIGGEPLLRFQLIRTMVKRARNKMIGDSENLNIVIVTNATLITSDVAQFLFDNNVFTIISIDGCRDVHDEARVYRNGKGSSDDVERGCSLLNKVGAKYGLCLTIADHNIEYLPEEAIQLIERFRPDDISVNGCLHGVAGKVSPHRVEIGELVEAQTKLLELLTEKGYSSGQVGRRFQPLLNRSPLLHYCVACNDKIVIGPDGKAGNCEGFVYLGFGLKDWRVILNQRNTKIQEKWVNYSPVRMPECQSCPWILCCGAGCRFDAATLDGSIKKPDSFRCQHEQMLYKWFITEYMPKQLEIKSINDDSLIVLNDNMRKTILDKLGFGMNLAWK